MPQAGLSKRKFLYLAAGIVSTLGVSSLIALHFGLLNFGLLGPQKIRQAPRPHRVAGGSMAPTLWSEHYQVECPHCHIRFTIDASPTSSLAQDANSQIPCWHCGKELDRPIGPTLPGDVVDAIWIDESTSLHRDQLVMIRIDGQLHLKRLLGTPGDTIAVDANAVTPLQLTVNGKPATSSEVAIPVDRDALRTESRWSSWERIDADHQASWQWTATQTQSPRLTYAHQNIHDFHKVTAVMDDCPANALIARPLYPVSTLQLRFQIQCSSAIQLITSFGQRELASGIHDLVFTGPNAELSIRVIAQAGNSRVNISQLEIDRFIDYRLRRTDDQSMYPIRLAKDEYYVMGDNVPISVDSRTYGPIHREHIVAVVPLERSRQLLPGSSIHWEHRFIGNFDR